MTNTTNPNDEYGWISRAILQYEAEKKNGFNQIAGHGTAEEQLERHIIEQIERIKIEAIESTYKTKYKVGTQHGQYSIIGRMNVGNNFLTAIICRCLVCGSRVIRRSDKKSFNAKHQGCINLSKPKETGDE